MPATGNSIGYLTSTVNHTCDSIKTTELVSTRFLASLLVIINFIHMFQCVMLFLRSWG